MEGKWVSISLTVTTIEVKGTLDREHLLSSRGTSKQCTSFPVDLVVRHVMAHLGTAVSFSHSRYAFYLLAFLIKCMCHFLENETCLNASSSIS